MSFYGVQHWTGAWAPGRPTRTGVLATLPSRHVLAARCFQRSTPSNPTGSAKLLRRSQPRRDGPGQPCAFFRWPPTRLPGGFPAPPIFDGGIVPEHLTTPLLLGAFFSLLRHGLRRCGAPGQRPSLFPAVPHRPTALVRFFHSPARSTLAVGREGRNPNIACQRRASSALGTPSCSTSRRYPSPVPTASTAGTSPIYSTAE